MCSHLKLPKLHKHHESLICNERLATWATKASTAISCTFKCLKLPKRHQTRSWVLVNFIVYHNHTWWPASQSRDPLNDQRDRPLMSVKWRATKAAKKNFTVLSEGHPIPGPLCLFGSCWCEQTVGIAAVVCGAAVSAGTSDTFTFQYHSY